jgi:hypothetical protein
MRYLRSPASFLADSIVRLIILVIVPLMKPLMECGLCRCRHKAHSIRGFISGHVTKKMGLRVESTKNEAGERTYRTK